MGYNSMRRAGWKDCTPLVELQDVSVYVLVGGLSDRTCEYRSISLIVNGIISVVFDTMACFTIQHP